MKLARNQPCPCGSGKKFKHCCEDKSVKPALDPSEALRRGIYFHQKGKLGEAERIYKTILVEHPAHADALHLLGLVCHSMGKSVVAYGLIQTAIKHNPASAVYHSNYADVCRKLDWLDEAFVAAQRACALQPNLPEAHYQYGEVLRAQKRNRDSVQALKQALALEPAMTVASLALAQAFVKLKQRDEALACLEIANVLRPGHFGVIQSIGNILSMMNRNEETIRHYQASLAAFPAYAVQIYGALAESYTAIGNIEAATDCYRRLLELRPNDKHISHFLKAVTGEHSDAPPPDYVRGLFDNYAETFDNHLVKNLEYRGHVLLGGAILNLVDQARNDLDCLDLGCGTGLLGAEIRKICRTLDGCDLSPKMIEQAHKRKIYDRLDVAELLSSLSGRSTGSVDLITAADVFIYVGQLNDVFVQSRRTLRPDGLLAFSIELLDSSDRDYALRTSGRYAHSSAYIRRLCEQTGYSVTYCHAVTLRKEADVPMPALLYILSAS